jgi:O-antigen/teichoic acid export membrane protein
LILAGVMLGPAALGGLKAAQGLVVGPTNVVVNGGGSFGLPEASRHFAERGWPGMARVSRIVTGAVVLAAVGFGVVVLVFAPTLLRLLYGSAFVSYAPCARIFAISLTIYAFCMGPILNLTTTRQVRPLFLLQLGRLTFSVVAVSVLANAFGVTGAAAADLLTSTFTLGAMLTLQSFVRRSFVESPGRTRVRFVDPRRRRLVKNASFLSLAEPPRPSSALPPANETSSTP